MQVEQENLIRQFVEAWDRERVAAAAFRNARQVGIHEGTKNEFSFGNTGLVRVCELMNEFLKERAEFIWAKTKEVIVSTGHPAEPNLSRDIKAILNGYMNPLLEDARIEFERVRQLANADNKIISPAIQAGKSILLKLEAEIDLFCAQNRAKSLINRHEDFKTPLAQVRDMFQKFVKAYDSENAEFLSTAYRRIIVEQTKQEIRAINGRSEEPPFFPGSEAQKAATSFIEQKSLALWEKLKTIIKTVEPQIDNSSVSEVESIAIENCEQATKTAELWLAEAIRALDLGSVSYSQTKAANSRIRARLEAEISLFCTEYMKQSPKLLTSNSSHIQIGTFTGILGDVSNAPIHINDSKPTHPIHMNRTHFSIHSSDRGKGWVFISHAGADKVGYIRPLTNAFDARGIPYWLDEQKIEWGDSLAGKINEGLRNSEFCLVCLSDVFLNRHWPEAELNSVLNLQFGDGKKRVLPLILNSKEAVLKQYPLIAGTLYKEYSHGVEAIAEEIASLLTSRGWIGKFPQPESSS